MKALFKEFRTLRALLPNKADRSGHFKVLSGGNIPLRELTNEQLAKINVYARRPLAKEAVFYVPLLMAHNGIDRDNERFSEDLLEEFAASLSGKGFFVEGHPSSAWSKKGGGPGDGLFFDARVEDMTSEAFAARTGQEIKLPEGVRTARALFADAYVLALPGNEETRAKIDAGIIRFASIGFKAPFFMVTDGGREIYGEYRSNGEALEGSLVWLGAQPAAGVIKRAHEAAPDGKRDLTTPQFNSLLRDGALAGGVKDLSRPEHNPLLR